jgi:hypothetical protein
LLLSRPFNADDQRVFRRGEKHGDNVFFIARADRCRLLIILWLFEETAVRNGGIRAILMAM